MLSIVTVYTPFLTPEDEARRDLVPLAMDYIRWCKVAEALAARGYHVDMAVADRAAGWPRRPLAGRPHVGRVPLSQVAWRDYDVVKTVFHRGFETLDAFGGADHPCIVSKLGSVVGPRDMDGVYFYGAERQGLYATQERIRRASRYVTVLSPGARALWEDCFGPDGRVLLVPGGVDAEIPEPGRDPYPADDRMKVLFAGNVYSASAQPEANAVLIDKLNALGRALARHGARLYMIGVGAVTALDPAHVTYLGAVDYDRSWAYLHHAEVGVVVSAGRVHQNNESTKIYHYLRAALPVVSESGFPNDRVVTESGLGIVAANGDMCAMADQVVEAARRRWDRGAAVRYILDHHTWDRRVDIYADEFARVFSGREA